MEGFKLQAVSWSLLDKGVKEHMDLIAKILEALLMRSHVEEAIG